MTRRRAFAPEVVQTSAMDCGPAALKCLLEGHGVPASYGRLREACQTDVDGTSIDTLEDVAQRLGLAAEQELVPADHLLLGPLPALAVVRHVDAATHFVVVWRRVGGWLQVMDPATGRRWVRARAFVDALYRHRMPVPEADWCAWAAGDGFADALGRRLARLGATPAQARARLQAARAGSGWRGPATLDAALRQVQALADAGGVARGAAALALVDAFALRSAVAADPCSVLPAAMWSALPLQDGLLQVQGAVLLRVPGTRPAEAALPPELAAALHEPPPRVFAAVWHTLREQGRGAPLLLAGAAAVAAALLALEALLLRGLFDLSALLAAPALRVAGLAALLVLLALAALVDLPLLAEALRQGRVLETRLRMAWLARLPRLPDRYFHSRPVSDMAERAHALQLTRALPLLALGAVQALLEGALTLAGVLWLAPDGGALAFALFGSALVLPLAAQPVLAERDLRLRQHAGALAGHTLDALLGLQPLRAHHAARALAAQHEGTLVDWTLAARASLRAGLAVDALQSATGTALAALLVWRHFVHGAGVGGSDLLLVYWVLKLPALGGRFAALAQQVPAQRNVLLRLLEPMAAPEEPAAAPVPPPAGPMAVAIEGGRVLAAGHEILRDVQLRVAPGEHVAIVGASGAGKSSLLGLLLGWHRLAEGRLVVDGHEQPPGHAAARRPQIAWVDPAVQLWNRSLHDNLVPPGGAAPPLGPALQAARLRGLLARLPQGLQTLLGEGGARLSGGEGQRVRLARALLAPGPRLVLLDEPFRGLDRPQRRALLAEARQWWQAQTLLCVTHDVGETLAFARVLVVEQGRIVEDGAPQALAAAPSRYRALLDAERELQATLWQGAGWRRITLRGGRVENA